MPIMRAAATARCWRRPRRWRSWTTRYGEQNGQPVAYGEIDPAAATSTSRFVPAGHVLGSAQIVLEHGGERVVVSGDYKRRPDPTCAPFEPVPCDIFVTEATFGLPVFRHPDTGAEIDRLLAALHANPDRCVLVGAYALGKAQRVIAELRGRGHDDADLHPRRDAAAVRPLCRSRRRSRRAAPRDRASKAAELRGQIVVAPPSALNDRWSRRLPDPITAMASGWMRVRQRARQKNVELPLIISDHADWDELTATLTEIAPERGVGHPRPRGGAGPLVHDPPDQGARAGPGRATRTRMIERH